MSEVLTAPSSCPHNFYWLLGMSEAEVKRLPPRLRRTKRLVACLDCMRVVLIKESEK